MTGPDDLEEARGLSGWAAMKDELESSLRQQGIVAKDAARSASALAEIWHIAYRLQASVERVAGEPDASDGLVSLLIELELADWNNPRDSDEVLRLWRLVTGTPWKSRRDQIDSVEETIGHWWRGGSSVRDAATLLVDLRLGTRRLAAALGDRDLLSLSERRPSVARKKIAPQLSEIERATRTLRELLEAEA